MFQKSKSNQQVKSPTPSLPPPQCWPRSQLLKKNSHCPFISLNREEKKGLLKASCEEFVLRVSHRHRPPLKNRNTQKRYWSQFKLLK